MPKTLTVADLPPARPGRDLPGGGHVEARQPVLYCRGCDESYSANPGDYWAAAPGTILRCGDCDDPFVLAERIETFVPVAAAHDVRMGIYAAWTAFDDET